MFRCLIRPKERSEAQKLTTPGALGKSTTAAVQQLGESSDQTSLIAGIFQRQEKLLQEWENCRLQEVPCIEEQDLCLTPSSRLAVSTLVAGFDPMVLLAAGSSKTSVTDGALQHCNAARWLGLIWFCKICGKTSTIMKCYLNDCVMWRWSGYGLRQNQ